MLPAFGLFSSTHTHMAICRAGVCAPALLPFVLFQSPLSILSALVQWSTVSLRNKELLVTSLKSLFTCPQVHFSSFGGLVCVCVCVSVCMCKMTSKTQTTTGLTNNSLYSSMFIPKIARVRGTLCILNIEAIF